jgi:hypothetical protein
MKEFGNKDRYFEEDGEIIFCAAIESGIDHGIAYRIREDGRIAGGPVPAIHEKTMHSHLELLFVNPEAEASDILSGRKSSVFIPRINI